MSMNWGRILCCSNLKSTKDGEQSRSKSYTLSIVSHTSGSNCGICLNNVETSQGRAIYIAECNHTFHFPCIATHTTLVCPVCNATWKDLPCLTLHNNNNLSKRNDVEEETIQIEIDTSQQCLSRPKQPQLRLSDLVEFYNDDEPIPFPMYNNQIFPIPEVDENVEQDQNDDANIFVNPKSLSEIKCDDSKTLCVKLMPDFFVSSLSGSHVTYSLTLKVKAPPNPTPLQRGATDLVVILEVGGNMSAVKLHMLRRAMQLIIYSLSSADRLAIVASSTTSKRLLPLRRMTTHGKLVAQHAVDRLVCGQGTSMDEALVKAVKVLDERKERNPIASIILLTNNIDGKVKINSKKNQQKYFTLMSSTRFAHIKFPVHWFWLGTKYEYSQHDSRVVDFAKCIEGILNVVIHDLKIQLGFDSSSTQIEISTIYLCSGPPTMLNVNDIDLGDLCSEKEKELLVEVRVPTSALGTHQVMRVHCMYKDPTGQEVVAYDMKKKIIVVLPPKEKCNGNFQMARITMITSQTMVEAQRLMKEKKLLDARDLVSTAQAFLLHSLSDLTDEFVRNLNRELLSLRWQIYENMREHQET